MEEEKKDLEEKENVDEVNLQEDFVGVVGDSKEVTEEEEPIEEIKVEEVVEERKD